MGLKVRKRFCWAVVGMLRVNVCFMMSLLKMQKGQPPAKMATALG